MDLRPATAFWDLFQQSAGGLAHTATVEGEPHRRLREAVRAIDPGLSLEFEGAPGAMELIVSADGKRALFPLARAVVAAAPRVNGWTVRALKPRRGFPAVVRWERVTLRTAEIVFDPLERPGARQLSVRILIPGLEEADIAAARNAVFRAIDQGLGEERRAEAIVVAEVRPLPEEVAAGDFFPLLELEMFVQWRDSRSPTPGDGGASR